MTLSCRCRRDIVSREGDSTEVSRLFYDKQMLVVVAGQVVDSRAREELREKVEADKWQVWLPDGTGLALGDACFKGCGEGFEGQSHMIGRISYSSASAMPSVHTQPSFSSANKQAIRLPGRTQRLSSRTSMRGSTLKLGWR